MPYRSARQRAYMHIHLPEIAARWDKEYGGAVSGDYDMGVMKRRKRAALEDLRSGRQKGAGARVKRHPPGKPYEWDSGSFHTRPQGKQYRSNRKPVNYGTPAVARSAPKKSPIKYF